MALVVKDRIKETTTTTGTGTLSLAGAVNQFQTFVAGVGTTNTTYYAIEDANGTAWEVGLGTVTDAAPDTLSRTTILASSTGSAISLSAGTHIVFSTYPAGKAVYLDANNNLAGNISLTVPYTKITGDTTITVANVVVFADATGGAIDVTLYLAALNGGKTVTIKKIDSSTNTVDVLRSGSETIDGATSVTLYHQNEAVTLVSDNSNWFIV